MGGRLGVWKGGSLGVSFKKACIWGIVMNFFSASNWMCARDARWRFPVKIPIWTLAGRCGRVFGWKSEMDPSWRIWRGDWLENCEWIPAGKSGRIFGQKFWTPPRLGQLDGVFVRKRESELLSEVDGDVVGRSERGCCLVQRIGPGLVKCGKCAGWGQWTVGCLEVPKPRLPAHFY